jgi:hypothetical protein
MVPSEVATIPPADSVIVTFTVAPTIPATNKPQTKNKAATKRITRASKKKYPLQAMVLTL